jgi:hypothetical protein
MKRRSSWEIVRCKRAGRCEMRVRHKPPICCVAELPDFLNSDAIRITRLVRGNTSEWVHRWWARRCVHSPSIRDRMWLTCEYPLAAKRVLRTTLRSGRTKCNGLNCARTEGGKKRAHPPLPIRVEDVFLNRHNRGPMHRLASTSMHRRSPAISTKVREFARAFCTALKTVMTTDSSAGGPSSI